MATSNLIALDADGVLIDYHAGYAQAWFRAFGESLTVKDPLGYHPRQYWGVPALSPSELAQLRTKGFTEETWATMPAIPGAVEACTIMEKLGFELACVTALAPQWQQARKSNLHSLGFNFKEVYAVGAPSPDERPQPGFNPKQQLLTELAPVLFVDDYLPYLQGLPQQIWRALIEGRPHQTPNTNPSLTPADSRHESLLAVAHWCKQKYV